VKWPTMQKVEKFAHMKANQILTIREGSGTVSSLEVKSKDVSKARRREEKISVPPAPEKLVLLEWTVRRVG
jgi:ABC-type lipoprotein release transport system permease subunit